MLNEHYYFIYRTVHRPSGTNGKELAVQRQPMATVCLVQGAAGEYGGRVARGIALCSDTEPFSRKAGHKHARKRAIRAYYKKRDNTDHTDHIRENRCDTPVSVYVWLYICRNAEDAVLRGDISQEMAERLPIQDHMVKSCADVHPTPFEDRLLKWAPLLSPPVRPGCEEFCPTWDFP